MTHMQLGKGAAAWINNANRRKLQKVSSPYDEMVLGSVSRSEVDMKGLPLLGNSEHQRMDIWQAVAFGLANRAPQVPFAPETKQQKQIGDVEATSKQGPVSHRQLCFSRTWFDCGSPKGQLASLCP